MGWGSEDGFCFLRFIVGLEGGLDFLKVKQNFKFLKASNIDFGEFYGLDYIEIMVIGDQIICFCYDCEIKKLVIIRIFFNELPAKVGLGKNSIWCE